MKTKLEKLEKWELNYGFTKDSLKNKHTNIEEFLLNSGRSSEDLLEEYFVKWMGEDYFSTDFTKNYIDELLDNTLIEIKE